MGSEQAPLSGPDLTRGVLLAEVPDGGMLLGHAGGEAVLLVRKGDETFAVGATCTHYGAPLVDGLVIGGELRCPWHHAAFDLRSGEPTSPPALNPLACWTVERQGDGVVVGDKRGPRTAPQAAGPQSVGIIGAGAAGAAAAEWLRRAGYRGPVTLFGREEDVPVDRPNLSKDYLAGNAPEGWVPLRPREFYAEQQIELLLGTPVTAIDPARRAVTRGDGSTRSFGALILATGARPVALTVPGAQLPHVHLLRSFADCRALIARLSGARRAVVVGASFIGLEVAASLRARGLEVDVVGREALPLERTMGPELGGFIRKLHEDHGVRFHLGRTVARIEADAVTLDDGARLPAEVVVAGIGVRPETGLAEAAGLQVDDGVLVDDLLQTSAPGVFAAGDLARHPGSDGERVRIEHWAVAQSQGQVAAANVLGARQPYRKVPFFWSQHYDVTIAYVGNGRGFEGTEVAGDLPGRDCLVAYRRHGRICAIASIFRDRDSLRAEALLAAKDQAGLEALLASARG